MRGNLEPVTAVAFADRAGGPLAVSTNDAPATSTSSASPSSLQARSSRAAIPSAGGREGSGSRSRSRWGTLGGTHRPPPPGAPGAPGAGPQRPQPGGGRGHRAPPGGGAALRARDLDGSALRGPPPARGPCGPGSPPPPPPGSPARARIGREGVADGDGGAVRSTGAVPLPSRREQLQEDRLQLSNSQHRASPGSAPGSPPLPGVPENSRCHPFFPRLSAEFRSSSGAIHRPHHLHHHQAVEDSGPLPPAEDSRSVGVSECCRVSGVECSGKTRSCLCSRFGRSCHSSIKLVSN